MGAVAASKGPLREIRKPIKMRRTLKGHFGKVYAMHWASDSQTLVSASQDGKLIIWNAYTTNKVQAIPLRSSWVMTCAFEQTKGDLIACGGLDNVCSIYNINQQTANARATTELVAHDGYLSCCRFIDEGHILTSSGDSSCIYWDVSSGDVLKTFTDHTSDVMSVAVSPNNPSVFVTGSVDTTAKIWDLRNAKCVQTHTGHEQVGCLIFLHLFGLRMLKSNCLRTGHQQRGLVSRWVPVLETIHVKSPFRILTFGLGAATSDGNAFSTGSDDSSCRLFDMRSYGEVNKFKSDKISCGITSVAFSKSGRLLFGGYDDFNTYVWDTLSDSAQPQALPNAHENRVSCLGTNAKGDALCTGSWDTNLKIWA